MARREHRTGRRWLGVPVAAAVASAVLLLAAPALAQLGDTVASGGQSLSSGTLTGTDVVGGQSCTSPGPCATDLLPSGSLPASGTTTATATVSAGGTVTPTVASVTPGTCGVQQVADRASGGDTGLVVAGVTYGASGPLGGNAISLDGTTGSIETIHAQVNPQGFTEAVWFRTTGSGIVMSFANVQGTSGATTWDRAIWVDPSGRVVFGVYDGATDEVMTSGTGFANGAWHLAIAESSAAGIALSVDGGAFTQNATPTASQVYTGYWHLGWGNETNGWPDAPSSSFFAGQLAEAAIVPGALGASEVATLAGTANLSAFETALSADTPSSWWTLQDSGAIPYTGALPGGGFQDSSGNGNTGTGVGDLTPQVAGPTPMGATATALGLDGSTGWVETTTSYADPGTISLAAWFETTTSGIIASFGNAQGTGVTQWDRHIWIDPTGHVVWGVYPGSAVELTSPAGSYANGSWHFVVAEISTGNGANAYMRLYLDGALVARNKTNQAANYTGWWHIGWGNASGTWTDGPSSDYFGGSLFGVGVVPSALSAAQVTALYRSTSEASYESTLLARAPTALWPLTDGATTACGSVEATLQVTQASASTCLYPAGAGVCPAPSTTSTLSGLASAGTLTLPVPTAANSDTLTAVLRRFPGAPASFGGLHVTLPITILLARAGFVAELLHEQENVELNLIPVGRHWDPYAGVLAGPVDGPARVAAVFPSVPAEPGLAVVHRASGFTGTVVRLARDGQVEVQGRTGLVKAFPARPGSFAVDGRPVTLVPPARRATPAGGQPNRTASGSLAVAGHRARVARDARILVEGVHDAELVERVWGDDLRIEGVVVERLDGADHLADVVAVFDPGPDRRLGVLLDHLLPGTKEARIADSVRHPDVLVTGTPFVDVWQAVRPGLVGLRAWPEIPRGANWKEGVCRHLGGVAPGELWRRILSGVRSYADLDPSLVGAMERLIDFVTGES